MNFQTEIMNKIEQASGRLTKEALLAKLNSDTVKMLAWALDPIVTFGVTTCEGCTSPDDGFCKDNNEHGSWWNSFNNLLLYLSRRELTGNAASESLSVHLRGAPCRDCELWARRIVNKDLRSGVQLTTLNKVFPGTVEPFSCALAQAYDPTKHDLTGKWLIQPKLDGLRMIVLDGVAYTRNGRTIDSVGHILEELALFGNDFVFDGEIMGDTKFDEDSGKIRRKGEGPNLDLRYKVFDCFFREEWISRKTQPCEARYGYLAAVLGTACPKYVDLVPSRTLTNPTGEDLFKLRDEYIQAGFEGAMLKDAMTPYVFKRSDSLLKLKDFKDADGVVTGVQEGRGRHKGRLGALIVSFDGVETRVGSGFSDEQRIELWENKSGKLRFFQSVVECQYQNKTPDGKLRFPVFVKFRPDKEDIK